MAITAPPTIAGAQKTKFTINRVDTCVLLKVTTLDDAPVHNERVLLILPSGQTRARATDYQGEAFFDRLGLPASTPLYVVLPDVLEAWTSDVVEYTLDQEGKVDVEAVPPADADWRGAMAAHAALNKDEVDKLEKVDPQGDVEARDTAHRRRQRNYRQRDATKYLVRAGPTNTPIERARVTLRIDRLTEEEKFAHVTETFMNNNAWYTSGTLNYDGAENRWFARGGAVCNQLANFFLGYWVNHNNAYTSGATSTDMTRQMENDSGTDYSMANYPYRGFRDVLDGPLDPPPLPEDDQRLMPVRSYSPRTQRDGTRQNLSWVRIRPQDLENNGGVWRLRTEWQDALATYNVYSYASRKPNGTFVFDHHGGFLIKDPQRGLLTFAADGYKAGGVYSHTPTVVKGLDVIHSAATNRNLHLLVWPIQPLRPGGYAAEGAGVVRYFDDRDMGDVNVRRGQSAIDPEFRQSLSRFVLWDAAPNP